VGKERVLEGVVKAGLATQGFCEEVRLWNVACVADEHANCAASIDDQDLGFVGRLRDIQAGEVGEVHVVPEGAWEDGGQRVGTMRLKTMRYVLTQY
jgi:hypothetical protein